MEYMDGRRLIAGRSRLARAAVGVFEIQRKGPDVDVFNEGGFSFLDDGVRRMNKHRFSRWESLDAFYGCWFLGVLFYGSYGTVAYDWDYGGHPEIGFMALVLLGTG